MTYSTVPLDKAYTLLNCGGLILVCSKAAGGRYDLAPLAWSCPLDFEPSSRLLFVCDPGHATYENVAASGAFAVALPSPAQLDLVMKTGSVSGKTVDKFQEFKIEADRARKVDVLVPRGVGAWLECRLLRTVTEGSVALVFGEVLHAEARDEAWKERLHYVSEKTFYAPGPELKLP